MARATFWNLIAKRYARSPVADQPSYERKLAQTAARLTPQSRLLEVGCGTGTTALWHAPSVSHVDAVDFSEAMIAIARQKAAAAGATNVRFEVSALEDLPPHGAYDAVLAMSLLHLLRDPAEALARLATQLRPGGFLFTSTACLGDMGGLVPRLVPLLGLTGLLPRVTPLTAEALLAMHEAAGLRVRDHWRPGPDRAVFVEAQRPE